MLHCTHFAVSLNGEEKCHKVASNSSTKSKSRVLKYLDTEASKIINRGSGIRMSWLDFFQKINKPGGGGMFIPDLRVLK